MATTKTTLEQYQEKRHFSRTPEPEGEKKTEQRSLIFVVQKHRARQLHYDFRLEMDGVLKSWAVPKGPSLDPAQKHLAVNVEDHPLDYAGFEGVIPQGEYGAGEVIVWDSGTYSPDKDSLLPFDDRKQAEAVMREGFGKGKISIFLRGQKLKGSFTLVKTKRGNNNWLFMKHKDEYATPGDEVLNDEKSVLSGRTLDDVKAGKQGRSDPPALKLSDVEGAHRTAFPGKVTPMLATPADAPFSNPDWIFEPKLDGYRIMARIKEGKVTLLSRRGNDATEQYSVIVPDLSKQPASDMLLDGEIIATDEKGKPCFQCLQDYLLSMRPGKSGGKQAQYQLIYYVFDLLYLNGYDLREVSLQNRKKLLQNTLRTTGQIRLVDFFEKDGEAVYRAAIKNGLEGVVAKHIDSTYETRRSQSWLKIKAMKADEFVVGGFTAGTGARANTFGALLLGQYNDKGEIVYSGHVGTGFDETLLSDLLKRLNALRTDKMPFINKPPLNAPTVWVKPQMVVEVKFSEWTKDGILRIPVFLRGREDKSSKEVHRAEAVSPPTITKKQKKRPQDPPDDPPDPPNSKILEQLSQPDENFSLTVGQKKIKLTNLDKVLWEETKTHPALTKRNLITYLIKVAPHILRYTKDRPLTLSRYPNGIDGGHFWQKHWPFALPDFVERVKIRSKEDSSAGEYMICNNLATLVWLGQTADIEFHTWFSRVTPDGDKRATDDILEYPDFLIFDLDPYLYSGKEKCGDEPELNRKGFEKVCEVALWLKEILDSLSLNAFVKTSGKTGLHVYVPIERNLEYVAVRSAAGTIGRSLMEKHPAEITMEWAVEKRKGKVFFDYNQNVRGKTLACAYSPRPSPDASVSTPLRWQEVGKVYPTDFSILTVPERLEKIGDLWADILNKKRDIEKILEKS